jgi:hypothetical protein
VVDELISKVKKWNEDQSEGISGFNFFIAHFFSYLAPSNFTIIDSFFTEQAVTDKTMEMITLNNVNFIILDQALPIYALSSNI